MSATTARKRDLLRTVVFTVFIERASAGIRASATVGRSAHLGKNKCEAFSHPSYQLEKPFEHRWPLLRYFNFMQQRRATQFEGETDLRIPEFEWCHKWNLGCQALLVVEEA